MNDNDNEDIGAENMVVARIHNYSVNDMRLSDLEKPVIFIIQQQALHNLQYIKQRTRVKIYSKVIGYTSRYSHEGAPESRFCDTIENL